MKNKIILLVAVMFMMADVEAQKFQLGAKVGTDIHKLKGESFNDRFSYGYHLGGFAEIGLGSKFSIQPEVLMSSVKVDTSSNFSDLYHVPTVSNIKLNYMKIPVLLNIKPSPFVSLQVGPQFSTLMDKSKRWVDNGKTAFKDGDFAMIGGIQLNISRIKLYGRYEIGLSNINNLDNKDKWRNQTVQLGVGFRLL